MRPFVLTTFFDGLPEHGGAYVHKKNMLTVFQRISSPALQVVVICSTDGGAKVVRDLGLRAVVRKQSLLDRLWGFFVSSDAVKRRLGPRLAKVSFGLDYVLRGLGTNLVIFSGDDARVLQVLTHNYVMQVWDFCHLEQPEFPEVAHNGEFERRQWLNRAALPKATALVVDSDYASRLVQRLYGIDGGRVHSAPFLVDVSFDAAAFDDDVEAIVRQRYRLTDPYVFYPAQFWPHKNHRYILRALRTMKDRGAVVPQLVLSGSDKGALSAVLALAAELGIGDYIRYCGFVPNEDMPYLYRGATALVMPTYFGPTNIPPMEAAALGVPVCYSDLPAFREQMGEAAFYMDLENPASLADELARLIAQPAHAAKRVAGSTKIAGAIQRHTAILSTIIDRYVAKLGA